MDNPQVIEPVEIDPPTIKRSPWGTVQNQYSFGPGIEQISTASHGGFKLNAKMNKKIPEIFRRPNGWYEEDCECSIVIHFLPDYFPTNYKVEAEKSLKCWFWKEYEQYFGTVVSMEESFNKKRTILEEANTHNFLVRSACGDWHDNVPKGFVGVTAKKAKTGEEAHFLVPASEYDQREGLMPFVIDTTRHVRTDNMFRTEEVTSCG